MELQKDQAGRFRANPEANVKNNCCFVDPDTPGTPLEDTGTIDTTSGVVFQGITYVGKDGQSAFYPFEKTVGPQAEKVAYVVQVSAGRDALKEALRLALAQHECDPIITVTGTGANFDVLHIGSGELESIQMDGAAESLSRGAISALLGADIELLADDGAEKKAEDTTKKGKKPVTAKE